MRKMLFVVCSLVFASHLFGQVQWTGGGGDGQWSNGANWSTGQVPPNNANVHFYTVGGDIYITSNHQIQQMHVYGPANVTLNIAEGVTFTVSNGGSQGIQVRGANTTINGPGLLALSTAGDTNPLDCGATPGFTLTYNAQIVAPGGGLNTSIETYISAGYNQGTVVMGYPLNAFTGPHVLVTAGHTLVVPSLANKGQPCSIGAGNTFRFNNLSTLRYTGTGGSTDRDFLLNGNDGGQVEQAGTGPLLLTGPVYNINNSAQTFVLRGDSSSEARITGNIYNDQGTLAIRKEGVGTWVLAGNNTFTGGLTINVGTLGLDSPTAAGNVSQIAMAANTTLVINPSAANGFTTSLPAVNSSGNIKITVPKAATASTVTLGGLNAVFVAITADGAGTVANRILITGLAAGPVGAWLTLNGSPATYDPVLGLSEASLPTQSLATKGSTLPNNPNTKAIIDSIGFGGPIALTAGTNHLHGLVQTVPGDFATVDTAGKYLMLNEAVIEAGANALTIGVSPKDGSLLPPLQVPAPPAPIVLPDSTAIANLNPLVWYDPADASTVSLYYGTVTNLANKGTGGATMDAGVRPGFAAPLYATGSASHSALPMLRLHTNGQGLESRANTGISGSQPRTLIAVMSRESASTAIEVSLGTGENRRRFSLLFYNNNDTRFSLHGTDINVAPVASAIPTVLSMINGVGGNNFAWQGFVNGTASSILTNTDMNTLDTPLYIGYLFNSTVSVSARGQVGEVLLFNTVLSDTDRKLVEDYLKAKWQLSPPAALQTQTSVFALRNDSVVHPLTVNAAVNEPIGSTVSLLKWGIGDVLLAGGVSLSGAVDIEDGSLTVNTSPGTFDTISGTISGAGKLGKDGDGTLFLSSPNLYSGGTDILGGTLIVGRSHALGLGPIVIADGATLDIGAGTVTDSLTNSSPITVSGAGVNGMGAIVNNGTVGQMNAFRNTSITLADDATFGGAGARWDLRAEMILDLAENTLTKVGAFPLYLFGGGGSCCISNAPLASVKPALHIQQGAIGLELAGLIHPNDNDREIVIDGDGRLGLYSFANPVNWKISPADGATIFTYGTDEYTNKNVVASDIELPGTLNLTSTGVFNKNFTGQFTGPGGLNVTNGGTRAMSLLSHPNNTFAGTVAVSNATVGLRYPNSLPGGIQTATSRLLLENASGVRVYAGSDGWTESEVIDFAECGLFTSSPTKYLQIDVAPNETLSLPALASSFASGLDTFGAGTISLDGDLSLVGGDLRTHAGHLVITNDVTLDAGLRHIALGEAVPADGSSGYSYVTIGGNAIVKHTDRGYNTGSVALNVATHGNSKVTLNLQDDAQVSSKFVVGGLDNGDTGSVGAVYQSGNSRWVNLGGANNDSRIGLRGHGHWQLDSGDLIFKGSTQIGWTDNGNNAGVLRQTGGTFLFSGLRNALPSNGTVSDSYGGFLSLSRGGRGTLHLEGGTFQHYGEMRILDDAENSSNNGVAIMTVTGDADVMTDRQIYIGHRNNGWAIVNLNGGKLTTTYFLRKNRPTANVVVNFNGGTLCVTNNSLENRLFMLENPAASMGVYIYGGGATLDIGHGVTRSIDLPLQPPDGQGVSALNITAAGTGYIAPPYVNITGGGGSGATAIANFDRETLTVTGIEITSPGRGYTSAPTVAFVGGGGSGLAATAAIAPNTIGGGLTKTGAGTLYLNAPNTYTGPTVIEDGLLILGDPEAIHSYSEIIIHDGTLNLGGHTVTNFKVSITGSGGIVNGKLVTCSAVKTGPDTATLDAQIEFAAIEIPPVAGLWEGWLDGRLNLADPNPGIGNYDSVELTTTAANGFSNLGAGLDYIKGKFWPYNSTWVYTGYIWNRTGETKTWTFAKSFDDDVWMSIDGIEYINHTTYNQVFKTNVTVTPGPHPIEIRFGQGNGGVGAMNTSWYNSGATLSLVVDWQGRGADTWANYSALLDPGDGSVFTLTADAWVEPDPAFRVLGGTLRLPTETALEPGLWEGRVSGAFNLTDANPCANVELTTAAANGTGSGDNAIINDKVWPLNSTYIYTGYIWNRSDDDVTWTFAEHFDDNVLLTIGGTVVLSNMTWNAASIGTITLAPGPHTFEVRFGQGSGGVGAPSENVWWGAKLSFGIDVDGNHIAQDQYFVKLEDPGDGSLLTRNIPFPSADLIGTVIAAADGAVLDLSDKPRPGLILSPAGDDAIGIMGIANTGNNALNGAIYRVTLGDGTDSDTLAFAGQSPVDLTGLTIVPSDVATETPLGNNYVIATADGGFIGLPEVEGFTDGKNWKIIRKGNQLLLTTQGGTVLILR